MLKIHSDVSLKDYTTMRLGGKARFLAFFKTEKELIDLIEYAKENTLKTLTLGGGSNIIFSDQGFDGLILVNQIKGIEIQGNNLNVGSGESWDKIVELSVEHNLVGLESLSLIPGTVGGAPVNNIGAYGQEVENTIKEIRAYDLHEDKLISLKNKDCHFRYRNSIFKSTEYGRYIITSITFQLTAYDKNTYQVPGYKSLQEKLSNINNPTPSDVRRTVIEIRTTKLPDPQKIANSGSFFKNPIIKPQEADKFIKNNPSAPIYPTKNGVKIAAGWLVENSGLKGYEHRGIKISEKQALVLINKSSTKFSDLETMINHIRNKVLDKYNIELEIEPEIIK